MQVKIDPQLIELSRLEFPEWVAINTSWTGDVEITNWGAIVSNPLLLIRYEHGKKIKPYERGK